MKQTEFNFLVTNLAAIANESFSVRCNMFLTDLSNDMAAEGELPTGTEERLPSEFDVQKYFAEADLQGVLDSGYASLDELATELDSARETLDMALLGDLLGKLPSALPGLSQKLTTDQLKQWISHVAVRSEDEPFYEAHNFVMAAFGDDGELDLSEFGLDDEDHAEDLIRLALIEDDVQLLMDNESDIDADAISVDLLVMAVFNGALKSLQWLVPRADLNEADTVALLNACIMNLDAFKMVYNLVSLNQEQKDRLTYLVEDSGMQEVMDFLRSV